MSSPIAFGKPSPLEDERVPMSKPLNLANITSLA
jgi:hypothetical protein